MKYGCRVKIGDFENAEFQLTVFLIQNQWQ